MAKKLQSQTGAEASHEHGNGNGVGINEIPDIAYLQLEFEAWLKRILTMNGIELDRHQQSALKAIVDRFADQCYELLDLHLFPNALNRYSMEDLLRFYVPRIEAALSERKTSHAVILDQAIYQAVSDRVRPEYAGRVHELSMGRPHGNLFTTSGKGKQPRVKYPPIVDQVAGIKKSVGKGEVFLVDDTTVEGGTMAAAEEFLNDGRVKVMQPENHMVYFLTLREGSGMDRPVPPYQFAVKMLLSRGSIELRECNILGGAQEQARGDNQQGFVIPAFPPFSDGKALRMAHEGNAILNLPEVAERLLTINREVVVNLAGVLGRKPGELKLGTFHLVPADPDQSNVNEKKAIAPNALPVGKRPFLQAAVNEALGREPDHAVHEHEVVNLPLTALIDHGIRTVEAMERPKVSVVSVDLDGALAAVKTVDPELEAMGGTRLWTEMQLGHHVQMRGRAAIRKLLPADRLASLNALASESVERILPIFYNWNLAEIAAEKFGEEAKQRIIEVFVAAYGMGRGHVEASRFIESMPLSYHAIRHLTWDLPLSEIYRPNPHAKAFARNITRRGGTLAIVSSAPKLHVLNALSHLGIMQSDPDSNIQIISVEDLYRSDTVPQPGQPMPDHLFVENDKSVGLAILAKNLEVPSTSVAHGGDSFSEDVRPALIHGFRAATVKTPDRLKAYALSVKLPGDDRSGQEDVGFEFTSLAHT